MNTGITKYILLYLVAAILFGCSGGNESGTASREDTGPAYGDIMVEGSIGDASNLIPLLAATAPLTAYPG